MSGVAVLDSSVIAALFFSDPCSEEAEKETLSFRVLYTLDLAVAEVANVAWKRIKFFGDDAETVKRLLREAVRFIIEACVKVDSRDVYEDALNLGVELSVPVYDGLFLALTERVGGKLLTCDEKLEVKTRGTRLHKAVKLLKSSEV
ncbi:MAG: type II toxin-antitoxin system VapC family toxin [Candidatus Jordarchaeales archaeon]|nr:type II toxin-antitoxin system VapC family toxin [Candidatus Jordarchaeia archaeon]